MPKGRESEHIFSRFPYRVLTSLIRSPVAESWKDRSVEPARLPEAAAGAGRFIGLGCSVEYRVLIAIPFAEHSQILTSV